MTDPNRDLIRAVDRLTTQVGRIAATLADGTAQDSFALAPPVVTDDDGAQTTGDNTPAAPAMPYKMCSASAEGAFGGLLGPCILRYQHYGPLHQDAGGSSWAQRMTVPDFQVVTETMRENEQLRTELARIRRALDPDDERYIQETVDDQLALSAKVAELETAIERVRAIKPSPARSECNVRTNAQDEGWDQALVTVRAALIGPIADDS
ncbi:hypothetical protein [Streptomyces sp. BE147]|uniref:hypothetical protein n=1 Tax=Streptomyces sp. BE147 TaxID=3002524 RepID=UPI002E7A0347|nr:hypothetical protein [Streptomyces sp. BE147]